MILIDPSGAALGAPGAPGAEPAAEAGVGTGVVDPTAGAVAVAAIGAAGGTTGVGVGFAWVLPGTFGGA